MAKFIVRNPLDELTCTFCKIMAGAEVEDIEKAINVPFAECENMDNEIKCRCYVEMLPPEDAGGKMMEWINVEDELPESRIVDQEIDSELYYSKTYLGWLKNPEMLSEGTTKYLEVRYTHGWYDVQVYGDLLEKLDLERREWSHWVDLNDNQYEITHYMKIEPPKDKRGNGK